jgi:heat shock protein HtpX
MELLTSALGLSPGSHALTSDDEVVRRNSRKAVGLLAGFTVLVMLVGRLFCGPSGMYLGALFALLTGAAACLAQERLALLLAQAEEAEPGEHPDLHAAVREVAERMGLPPPSIFLIDDLSPNAFAVGRDPSHAALAITSGLLELLGEEEGEAVIAHELLHVQRRESLVGGTLTTLILALTLPIEIVLFVGRALVNLAKGEDWKSWDEPGATRRRLMLGLAPLIAPLVRLALPRRCEFEADALTAQSRGPGPLERALRTMTDAINGGPTIDADPATYHLFIVDPAPEWTYGWLMSNRPTLEDRLAHLQGRPSGGLPRGERLAA